MMVTTKLTMKCLSRSKRILNFKSITELIVTGSGANLMGFVLLCCVLWSWGTHLFLFSGFVSVPRHFSYAKCLYSLESLELFIVFFTFFIQIFLFHFQACKFCTHNSQESVTANKFWFCWYRFYIKFSYLHVWPEIK